MKKIAEKKSFFEYFEIKFVPLLKKCSSDVNISEDEAYKKFLKMLQSITSQTRYNLALGMHFFKNIEEVAFVKEG